MRHILAACQNKGKKNSNESEKKKTENEKQSAVTSFFAQVMGKGFRPLLKRKPPQNRWKQTHAYVYIVK